MLGSTLDDSVGESFDKVARLLELSEEKDVMHGGKLVEMMALQGDPSIFQFTEPMRHRSVMTASIASEAFIFIGSIGL